MAISLISEVEALQLTRIAKQYGIEMQERPAPTDADVEAVVAGRVTALLEAQLRERGLLQTERSRRFLSLARTLAESEDEMAVIAMLLDEYYQQSLHRPVMQPEEQSAPPPRQQQQPSRPQGHRGGGRPGRNRSRR